MWSLPEGEPRSENALQTLFRWPRRGKKGCRRGGGHRRRVPGMRTEGCRCAFLERPFPRRTRGSASLPVEGARGRVALPRDHAGGKSPKGPKWVRPVAPAGRISGLCTGRTKSTLAYSRARRMVGRDVPAEPFLPVFQTSCPLPRRLAGDGSPHQGPCHPIKGHQKSKRKGGGAQTGDAPAPAGRISGLCKGRTKSKLAYSRARCMVGEASPPSRSCRFPRPPVPFHTGSPGTARPTRSLAIQSRGTKSRSGREEGHKLEMRPRPPWAQFPCCARRCRGV